MENENAVTQLICMFTLCKWCNEEVVQRNNKKMN